MAKMLFTGRSNAYIFDGSGGNRDQLEQAILSEFQAKQFPLKAIVKTIKTGGMLFGSSEQCIVIEIDKDAQIAISNNTVGTYLYVEAYLMVQEKNALFGSLSSVTDNVFKQQKRNAVFCAALEAMESAFGKLNLKQSNSGFRSERASIKEED